MKKIKNLVNCIMIIISVIVLLFIFFIRTNSSNNVQIYNIFNQKIFIPNYIYSDDLMKNNKIAFLYKDDISYNDIKLDDLIVYKLNNNEKLFNISNVNDFYISINNNKKIILRNGEDINYDNQFMGIVTHKSKMLYYILTTFSRDINIAIILIIICFLWLINYLVFFIFLNYNRKEKFNIEKLSYLENFNKDIINAKKIYKIKPYISNNINLDLNKKQKKYENNNESNCYSEIVIHKKSKNDIINSKNNIYIKYNDKEKE